MVRRRRPGIGRAVLAVGLCAGTLTGIPAATASPQAECAMTRTGEYELTVPEIAGLDPAKLQAALDYAAVMGSQSIKVFRRGCLVGQGVRDALHNRIPTNNWGQAKTVVALLTGIAADRGHLEIDTPIGRYLPAGLGDDAHRAVTLRHLLTAASGAQVNQVRGLNVLSDVSRVRDWFAQPMVHQPGTYYFYDQLATSVIVYVTEQAVSARLGREVDYQEFAQTELFDNLGIPASSYFWQRDRSGTTSGYSQLFMRPLEFGRLGHLILNDGFFDDKQVISRRYLTQLGAASPANCGYGFLTFRNACTPGQLRVDVGVPVRNESDGAPWIASAPADMLFTDGVGTRTWVIPSLDMVVTRNGEQEFDTVPALLSGDLNNVVPGRLGAAGTHEFFRLLMAAVTDLPAGARIASTGPYTGPPRASFDPEQYVNQPGAFPESYFGLGLPGCHPFGCAGEPNDGVMALLTDIPRTGPGVFGTETRPDGSGPLT